MVALVHNNDNTKLMKGGPCCDLLQGIKFELLIEDIECVRVGVEAPQRERERESCFSFSCSVAM